MSEVRFYHLTRQPLEIGLPAIVSKAHGRGHKILIKCANAGEVKKLNDVLWTYHPDSFLPHGTANDDHADLQPILITHDDENLNKAETLILCGGATSDHVKDFSLTCEMLEDHNTDLVTAARTRFKSYKEAGHAVTYWFQGDAGWEKK